MKRYVLEFRDVEKAMVYVMMLKRPLIEDDLYDRKSRFRDRNESKLWMIVRLK